MPFLILIAIFSTIAQNTVGNEGLIKIEGRIISKENATNVSFVHIFNKTTNSGTVSDEKGRFVILISVQDTILLSSVGFEEYIFTFSEDSLESDYYYIEFFLNHSTLELSPITIYGFKEELEFKKDILTLELPSKQSNIVIPGSFEGTPQPAKTQVIFNGGVGCEGCLALLQNLFNKDAEEQKEYTKALADYSNQKIIQKKYNREIVQNITKLENEKLNKFMIFCKMSDNFILKASEMDILLAINECYKNFLEIKEDK